MIKRPLYVLGLLLVLFSWYKAWTFRTEMFKTSLNLGEYLFGIWIIFLPIAFLSIFLMYRLSKWLRKSKSKKKNGEMTLTEERIAKARKIILIFSLSTLGTGYILYFVLRLLVYELARQNRYFLLRSEGEHKPVMRGDVCVRYVTRVDNHRIDPWGFDVFKGSNESYAEYLVKVRDRKLNDDPSFTERKLELDTQNQQPIKESGYYQLTEEFRRAIDEANSPTVFEEIFGVDFVGFKPYRVFGYPYRWIEYGQERSRDATPSKETGMHPRDEFVYSLYHRYPKYGIEISKAETGAGSEIRQTTSGIPINKVQVNVLAVFETETVNPHKSLFRTGALSSAGVWQQALVKEITARLISWIKATNWDELNQKDAIEKELREICRLVNGVDEYDFRLKNAEVSSVKDYGQRVLKISVVSIELEDKELQKASEKVFIAERGAEEATARARGERAKAAAPLLGKADGFKAISEVDQGPEMVISENLGKIGVYAPGGGGNNLLLNITEGLTTKRPARVKAEKDESLSDQE